MTWTNDDWNDTCFFNHFEILKKTWCLFAFSIISRDWDGISSWKPSSWKTKTYHTQSIPWQQMIWQLKPRQQLPWYWPSSPPIFWPQYQHGYGYNEFDSKCVSGRSPATDITELKVQTWEGNQQRWDLFRLLCWLPMFVQSYVTVTREGSFLIKQAMLF